MVGSSRFRNPIGRWGSGSGAIWGGFSAIIFWTAPFTLSIARWVSLSPNFLSAHAVQKNMPLHPVSSNPLVAGAAQLSQNDPLSPIAMLNMWTSFLVCHFDVNVLDAHQVV